MVDTPTILVIADNPASLERTVSGIASEFLRVVGSLDPVESIQYFLTLRPEVVFFTFNSVDAAEQLYLGLMQQVMSTNPYFFQAVLLCAKDEENKAYKLWFNNVFDEFLVDKPNIDYFQLLQLLRRALERNDNVRQQGVNILEGSPLVSDIAKTFIAIQSAANVGTDALKGAKVKLDAAKKLMIETLNRPPYQVTASGFGSGAAWNLNERLLNNDDTGRIQVEDSISSATAELGQLIDSAMSGSVQGKRLAEEALQKLKLWIATKKCTILVVEDDPIFQEIIQRILQSAQYNVVCASGGHEVRSLLNRQQKIDFIFMDYELPHVSGTDLVSWIRVYPWMSSVPIVMLTSHSDIHTITLAEKAGIADYVVKPATRQIVLEKVKKYIAI